MSWSAGLPSNDSWLLAVVALVLISFDTDHVVVLPACTNFLVRRHPGSPSPGSKARQSLAAVVRTGARAGRIFNRQFEEQHRLDERTR